MDIYSVARVQALQETLDRQAFARMADAMRADPVGRGLLRTRSELWTPGVLERLAASPKGSLGQAVFQFLDVHGFEPHADQVAARPGAPADVEYAKHRHRATHDVRHALLGLGATPEDEVLVHAFQLGQQAQWVSRLVVIAGLLALGTMRGRFVALARRVAACWRAGRRAPLTLNTPFEDLWELPLDDVRARLGIRAM
jgi:ubiquinone biosynthesis protein Coq4